MCKMIWLFWFLPALCLAEPKTICLNMIVKDEKAVIERCLNSLKPYIDYWVIVDTGSTDGTQSVIEKCLSNVPGELFERKWVNFAHNRNEALELAKGKADYVLFIDADEIFEGSIDKERLTEEAYSTQVRHFQDPLITFGRAFLVKDGLGWMWKGIIHEHIQRASPFEWKHESSFVVNAEPKDGNRSKDSQKFFKDAEILEKALQQEPENSEYVFYLAQTYCCLKKYEEAIRCFRKYLTFKCLVAEYAFWAYMQMGRMQEELQEAPDVFIDSYSKAFQLCSTKAEPLFYIGMHFYKQEQYLLAYVLLQFASQIPLPASGFIYTEHSVYQYGIQAMLANCAFALGRYEEAVQRYTEVGENPATPSVARQEAQQSAAILRKELNKENQTNRAGFYGQSQ